MTRRPHATRRRTRRASRAFTLIEVLIAVVILAFGLLGIGVLFPMVIRQQRISADETMGVIAANSAKDTLLATSTDLPTGTSPDLANLWPNWRKQLWGDDQARPLRSYADGLWTVPHIDDATGGLEIGPQQQVQPTASDQFRLLFRMKERVYPPSGSVPRMIWDIAVQPVDDGDGNIGNDPIRVAVFVRRVDGRLRDPSKILTASPPVLPVAVDSATGLPVTDQGSGQSRAVYAKPVVVRAQIERRTDDPMSVRRDRIYFPARAGVTDEQWALIRQLNQVLVDSTGQTYTVRGWPDAEQEARDGRFVEISPQIPASITIDSIRSGTTIARSYRVVFTPQPPAAVTVFEVNP